jgi:hypothetical protein
LPKLLHAVSVRSLPVCGCRLTKKMYMKGYFIFIVPVIVFLYSCGDSATKTYTEKPLEDTPAGGQAYVDSIKKNIKDLSAVENIKELLCQQWEHEEDKQDAAYSNGDGDLQLVYRGFAFFDDGTMLQNPHGEVYTGKWQYDDAAKTITIRQNKGGMEQYKINKVAVDELVLTKMGDNTAKSQKYIGQAMRHIQNTTDPFYPPNNSWRFKPSKPETDAEIKQRAKDCLKFYLLYYNDNKVRDSSVISFAGFPTCFIWYGGGISIFTAAKLPSTWVNCFYNRQQALKAHAMMEELVTKKYHWSKGQNWVIMNAKVLKQMYERF